jgi:hypothetical protein
MKLIPTVFAGSQQSITENFQIIRVRAHCQYPHALSFFFFLARTS